MRYLIIFGAAALLAVLNDAKNKAPNIVFMISDDLGWNDASFHGGLQCRTPTIDKLADESVVLENYYTFMICTPTRASLLTGRHAIHTGVYDIYGKSNGNSYLNHSFSLLPTYLKSCCNYATHMVGKWHLGFGTMARLPTSRGFDSYFGCLSGGESHTSHISDNAYDFSTTTSNTYTPALEYKGVYSTPAFLDKALEIFAANRGNAPEKPFYLHLAWQDPHWPLEASAEYLSEFADIKDSIRQQVCAMTLSLDDGISKVLSGLKQYGLWDNTVVVYVNDHGGGNNGAEGTNNNNYPLPGGKNTLWEGGVRTVGLLRAPGVAPYKNRDKFHVSDWLPTLVGLASGTDDETAYAFSPDGEPAFQYGDGLNLWPSLSSTGNQSKSARRRDWVLLETHPPSASSRSHGDALIIGDMKLIKWNETNPPIEGGWVPPPGEDTATTKYSIDCKGDAPTLDPSQCHTHWCLFNITADPCEYKDLSNELPEVVSSLVRQLEVFQTTAVTTGAADGCSPVAVKLSSGDIVWAPCDAPEVLAGATLVTHPPQAQAQAPVLVQILRQEA